MFNFVQKKDGERITIFRQKKDGTLGKPLGMCTSEAQVKDRLSLLESHAIAGGEKYWDDDEYWGGYYVPTLWDDDVRCQYNPMGATATTACANCHWFQASGNKCAVKCGDAVATGLCKMWLTDEVPPMPNEPLPVVIVDKPSPSTEDESGMEMGSMENKTSSILEQISDLIKVGLQSLRKDAKSAENVEAGFKVYDNGKWVAWWSNNFEDKTGETFSAKAHSDFIYRVDKGLTPYPELWYRHVPVAAGVAEWVGQVGHLMLAAGKFYDTEVGKKFLNHYRKSKIEHTVSHGYLYLQADKQNGVYHAYNTYEISPLLPGEEANPYTGFGVKEMFNITEQKRKDLESIIGTELAARVLQVGEEKSKQLEELGVKFKSTDPAPVVDDVARQAATELATAQKGFEASTKEQLASIASLLEQVNASLKAITEGEAARTQRIESLEAQVKGVFGVAPRASQNNGTVVSEADPYVQFLKSKQGEQQIPQGSVFGDMLKGAGFEFNSGTPPAQK